MRLPVEKVELAVSTDPERPNLRSVRFDRERAQLTATDGHIAAVVPIDDGSWEQDDVTSNLDPEAIARARKELTDEILGVEPEVKSDIRKRGSVITASPDGVTLASGKFYPVLNTQAEFPAIEALPFERDPRRYDQVISLNAALLHRLAKAITPDAVVRIYISKRHNALFVEPVPAESRDHSRKGEGKRIPYGFIMPVSDAEMDVIFGRTATTDGNGAQAEA